MSAGAATNPLPKSSCAAVMRRSMGWLVTERIDSSAPKRWSMSMPGAASRPMARLQTAPMTTTTATMATQPEVAASRVMARSAAVPAVERAVPT